MIRALWTSASGMQAQQLNIDVIANNLANVNTTGFKKSRADFQDLLYQTLRAPGAPSTIATQFPTGIQVGLGSRPAAVPRLILPGATSPTQIGQLQTARFANPAGLRALGKNLMQESDTSGPPQLGTPGQDNRGTLLQGFLENSNVSVVEELVALITGQRAYEVT